MSKINFFIFPEFEKELFFKNDLLHYEETYKGIKTKPIPIKSANFKKIQTMIIKENILSYVKNHIGGDIEKMDDEEFEKKIKKLKTELEEAERKEEESTSGLEGKQEKEEMELMEIEERKKKEKKQREIDLIIRNMKKQKKKVELLRGKLKKLYRDINETSDYLEELKHQQYSGKLGGTFISGDDENYKRWASKKLKQQRRLERKIIPELKEKYEKIEEEFDEAIDIREKLKREKEDFEHENAIITYKRPEYHGKDLLGLIGEDIMNIIFEMLKDYRDKKTGSVIKTLFITSKGLREYYLRLFLDYLTFNANNEFLGIYRHQFKRIHFLEAPKEIFEVPHNVTDIQLKNFSFTGKAVEELPYWIESLTLGDYFNDEIMKYPRNLKKLEFGYSFNRTLFALPDGLKYLSLGHDFDKIIYSVPDSLKELKISGIFNQLIGVNKSTSLENITIMSQKFNESVSLLPNSLKNLIIFSTSFDKRVNKLPESLESFSLASNSFRHPLDNLPHKLKHLYIYIRELGIFNQFYPPKSLETLNLTFSKGFNLDIRELKNLHLLILNYFSEDIDLGYNFLGNLPRNLKVLNLLISFDQNIDDLSDFVEKLVLGENFNHKIRKFPKNLKELWIHKDYLYLDELKNLYPYVKISVYDDHKVLYE